MLEGIYNSTVAYGASTEYGKRNYVVPILEEELKSYLDPANERLGNIQDLLPEDHKIHKTFKDVIFAADQITTFMLSEETLNGLADIIGNHIKDFKSVDDFKAKVPEMASVKRMKAFAAKLIDVEHYEHLETLLNDIHNFESLNKKQQKPVLQKLSDGKLVEAIKAENGKLKVEQIKKDVRKMAEAVCKELKLSKPETSNLIGIFDTLTDEHLETLNKARKKLVEQLPAYFEAEHKRLDTKPKAAITYQFANKKDENKKKRKVENNEEEVSLNIMDQLHQTKKSKTAKK